MRILKIVLIGTVCAAGVAAGICAVRSRSSTRRRKKHSKTYDSGLNFEMV